MAIKTQGTNVYVIDPYDNSVITVACATSLSGISASRDQIETTCLEATSRSYEAGMLSPGAASIGINYDPSNASHVRLHEIYADGTSTSFAVGWSDGTAAPTVNSAGDWVIPTSRSWITFDGYISEFPFEFGLSAVVTSTLSIQISGFPVVTAKV
jgi:hypothetical protein